jgi:hypothetical protein
MKKLKHKLLNNTGETIAETLVALLISALALVMLAGAISSTAKMITTSDKKMGEYYSKDATLVSQSGTDNLTVSIAGTGFTESRTVKYALNDAFASKVVVAYK